MTAAEERPAETASPRLKGDALADGILILLTLTVAQRAIGVARAVLFCRWLDPEQLGQWDMAFSFLMLAAPLSVLALSSSFRRYVEHYRQRGLLRSFLRRTTLAYAALGSVSVCVILAARGPVSQIVFGTLGNSQLVALMAVTLIAVIAHHYFLDLFGGLRKARLLAGLQMANSLVFAVAGVALLAWWRCDASSVVIAFGLACVVTSAAGAFACLGETACPGDPPAGPGPIIIWPKILPFVAWISLANFMGAMFDVADRYMIVHWSNATSSEALAQIGVYHSCRILPLLLVSVVAMAGSIITPHLSHDWESGNRERVGERLQLLIKLFAFGLTSAGTIVLFASPLLFSVALQGKFEGAMSVLPWTLTYCCWFALFGLLQNYVWCCEKAHSATIALFCGLILNVGLNLLLLPRLGLLGAVLATAVANVAALACLFAFCRGLGLRLDRACWVAAALPIAICLGPLLAGVVLAAVTLGAAKGDFLLNPEEKRSLVGGIGQYLGRGRRLFPARDKERRPLAASAPLPGGALPAEWGDTAAAEEQAASRLVGVAVESTE